MLRINRIVRSTGCVPRQDVNFLKSVVKRLDKEKLTYYRPHKNRNAFAMILRFRGLDGVRVARMFSPHDIGALTAADIVKKLESEAVDDAESSLSLFFMRQKDTEEHRWSSAVTFPGGARDKDDDRDDLDCVRRHAYDQLGIPLKGHFVNLGRLRDFWSWSRDLSRGTMSARFVFLHIGDMTPTLRLADHLVRSAAWVPIALLSDRKNVHHDRVKHPFYSYVRGGDNQLHTELRDNFSSAMMHFPSIKLPGELGEHFGEVWGSALSWTSSMMVFDGRPRIDWPLVSVPNSFFLQNMVIYPAHAVLELSGSEAAEGVPINPWHVMWLMFDVSLVVAFFAWWIYVVYATGYVIWDSMFRFSSGAVAFESDESKKMEEAAAETIAGSHSFFKIPWRLINPVVPDSKIGARTPQEYREELETLQMLHKLANQVDRAAVDKKQLKDGGVLLSWNSQVDNPIQKVVSGSRVDFGRLEDIAERASGDSATSFSASVSSHFVDPNVAATVLAAYSGKVEKLETDYDKGAKEKAELARLKEEREAKKRDTETVSTTPMPRKWDTGSNLMFQSRIAAGRSSAESAALEMRERNEEAAAAAAARLAVAAEREEQEREKAAAAAAAAAAHLAHEKEREQQLELERQERARQQQQHQLFVEEQQRRQEQEQKRVELLRKQQETESSLVALAALGDGGAKQQQERRQLLAEHAAGLLLQQQQQEHEQPMEEVLQQQEQPPVQVVKETFEES